MSIAISTAQLINLTEKRLLVFTVPPNCDAAFNSAPYLLYRERLIDRSLAQASSLRRNVMFNNRTDGKSLSNKMQGLGKSLM